MIFDVRDQLAAGPTRSGAVDVERSVERNRFGNGRRHAPSRLTPQQDRFEGTAANRGPSTPYGRSVSLSPRARWSRADARFRTTMEENVSVSLALNVNGKPVSADVDARTLLVDFLRNNLALTGTHVGCDTAQCGACTVHLDGRRSSRATCSRLQAKGGARRDDRRSRRRDGTLHPMQAAFKECHGAAMRLLHAGHGDERASIS